MRERDILREAGEAIGTFILGFTGVAAFMFMLVYFS